MLDVWQGSEYVYENAVILFLHVKSSARTEKDQVKNSFGKREFATEGYSAVDSKFAGKFSHKQ